MTSAFLLNETGGLFALEDGNSPGFILLESSTPNPPPGFTPWPSLLPPFDAVTWDFSTAGLIAYNRQTDLIPPTVNFVLASYGAALVVVGLLSGEVDVFPRVAATDIFAFGKAFDLDRFFLGTFRPRYPTATTQLRADARRGDTLIAVAATAGLTEGDRVSLLLPGRQSFQTTVDGLGTLAATLSDPLPADAPDGTFLVDLDNQ